RPGHRVGPAVPGPDGPAQRRSRRADRGRALVRRRAGHPAVTTFSRMTDPVRLAVGTLTVVPTPPPSTVDRRVAGWAMALAPSVGLLLGVVGGVLLWLVDGTGPVLAAALTIGLLALLTRAIHLDGLADTADGLGSGKPAPAALEVMRRGDVG